MFQHFPNDYDQYKSCTEFSKITDELVEFEVMHMLDCRFQNINNNNNKYTASCSIIIELNNTQCHDLSRDYVKKGCDCATQKP